MRVAELSDLELSRGNGSTDTLGQNTRVYHWLRITPRFQIEDKLELIHTMDQLGIQVVNVGLPASSRRNFEHALAACREIERAKLPRQQAA